jgi:hypothetical protein
VVLSWVPDWSWGLPLLVLTVVAHVSAILGTAKMLVMYRRGKSQAKIGIAL